MRTLRTKLISNKASLIQLRKKIISFQLDSHMKNQNTLRSKRQKFKKTKNSKRIIACQEIQRTYQKIW